MAVLAMLTSFKKAIERGVIVDSGVRFLIYMQNKGPQVVLLGVVDA